MSVLPRILEAVESVVAPLNADRHKRLVQRAVFFCCLLTVHPLVRGADLILHNGKVVTAGGRVLCVTALGENVKIAAERAYEVTSGIRFEGMQYRRDIGHRAIHRK